MKKRTGNRKNPLQFLLLFALCFVFCRSAAAEGLPVSPAPAAKTQEASSVGGEGESSLPPASGAPESGTEENSRFVTVTLHAGEHGCFADPEVKEKQSVQFRAEAFADDTVPDALDKTAVFLGWSSDPEAAEADVVPGVTHVSTIGTDLYAVWTDKCLVSYQAEDGYIETIDGQPSGSVMMVCTPGSHFEPVVPKHANEACFDFGGWYTAPMGQGTAYTAKSILSEPEIVLYARWMLAGERIAEMEPDTEYELEPDRFGWYFVFTPEETAVYEIIASNDSGSGCETLISVTDADRVPYVKAEADAEESARAVMEMKAGETYYLQIREASGKDVLTKAVLRRAECAEVTFHAGREGEAWFDGDQELSVRKTGVPAGTDLNSYPFSGLEVRDKNTLEFLGWSRDPDAEVPDDGLTAENGLEIYAVFRELKTVVFDANGGLFPADGSGTVTRSYVPGTLFVTADLPRHADNTLGFAGWSRDPDAEAPDADLLEGITPFDEAGDTLYAVYGEKLLETFSANGGYLMDDPMVTSCQSTKGKGHIFCGQKLCHDNSRFEPLGWTDQNGVFIPYTTECWPYYRLEEDTVFTAVWAYTVFLDANGGVFSGTGTDEVSVSMELGGLFSLADAAEMIGEAVNDSGMKYFAGWASSAEADEPDVFEDETPVRELDRVYAVWKDDSYILEEGGHAAWEKGTAEGLRFVVKRAGDDRAAFPAFRGVTVDGENLPDGEFRAEEGSLILTLLPTYLETAEAGRHEIVIRFTDYELKSDFTVTVKETEPETAEETPSVPESTAAPEPEPKGSLLPPEAWYAIGGGAILLLGVILLAGRKKNGGETDENDPLERFLQEKQERMEHPDEPKKP